MLSFDSIDWMIELPFYYQLFLIYNLKFTSIQSLFESYKWVHHIHWYLFCASTVRRWTLHRNCIDRAAFMQNDFVIAQRTYSRRLLSFASTKESTPVACSLWLLKEVGPWCTQQFSSIISSSANSTDAGQFRSRCYGGIMALPVLTRWRTSSRA